ncbi:hypothetical protein NH340_JMT00983 [Sarcoptes scabiei]|nr:hypothetical protein NH340_JMT00983 [Sarcoptes scabiei]
MESTMEIDQYSPRRLHKLRTPGSSGKKFRNYRCDLFKNGHVSPRWMMNYREKCLDELNIRRKERQYQLISKFRNQAIINDQDEEIQQVMQNVWKQSDYCDDFNPQEYHGLFEQLKSELIQEENDYWQHLDDEIEDELLADQFSVVCMSCLKSNLKLESKSINESLIYCDNCSFKLSLKFKLTGEQFFELINQHLDHHSANCSHRIEFIPLSVETLDHRDNVQLVCKKCKFDRLLFNHIPHRTESFYY